jgi:PD-(D/E)XK nuclease superfamily
MQYSYTQIAHYLACPRRYRFRYLEGWQERQQRASLLFGRAFEQALAAYFRGQDATATLYDEWSRVRSEAIEYGRGESWEQMWRQGIQLLQLFAQDDRVRIPHPARDLQRKVLRCIDSRTARRRRGIRAKVDRGRC